VFFEEIGGFVPVFIDSLANVTAFVPLAKESKAIM